MIKNFMRRLSLESLRKPLVSGVNSTKSYFFKPPALFCKSASSLLILATMPEKPLVENLARPLSLKMFLNWSIFLPVLM